MSSSQLEALLKQRQSEGRQESSGEFTVAMSRAREKLTSHQLERPGSYLQKILQGLIGLGPTDVEIRLQRREVLFEMQPTPTDLIPRVQAALLNPLQEEPALKDLAVGLNSAFGQGIVAIQVVSYDGLSGQLLEIGDTVSKENFRAVRAVNRLYIRLTRQRPPNLARWFLGPANLAAEHHSLSQGFAYCPIPVKLDGRFLGNPTLGSPREGLDTGFRQANFHLAERFVHDANLPRHESIGFESRGQRRACVITDDKTKKKAWQQGYSRTLHNVGSGAAAFLWSNTGGEQHPCSAMFGLRYDLLGDEAFVVFVMRGLITEVIKADLGCPGLIAVCSAAGLSTDISLFRLARDEALEKKLEWIRSEVKTMIVEFHTARNAIFILPNADKKLNTHLAKLPWGSDDW